MIPYRLTVQPEAEQDLAAARAWYEAQQIGLGERFVAAFDQVRKFPSMYPIAYRRCRQYVVRRFPYVVYYLVDANQVAVIGVFHARRDPVSWQQRVDRLS